MKTRPLTLRRLVELEDQQILPVGWVTSFAHRFSVNPVEEARLALITQAKEDKRRSIIGRGMLIASLLLFWLVMVLPDEFSLTVLEKYGIMGCLTPFVVILIIGGILYFRVPTTLAPNASLFCETLEKAADMAQLEVEVCVSNPNAFVKRARAFLASALTRYGASVHHEGYETLNLLGVVH